MTGCATAAGLRSIALRERSHNDNPELAGVLDSVAGELDRLTRDLAEARAEVVRVTGYRDGLVLIEAQKDAEIARLRAALAVLTKEPLTKEKARRIHPDMLEKRWATYTDHGPKDWEGFTYMGPQNYGNPYNPDMTCLLWVKLRVAEQSAPTDDDYIAGHAKGVRRGGQSAREDDFSPENDPFPEQRAPDEA